MSAKEVMLMKSLEWIVDIDHHAIIGSVRAEREKNPNICNEKLAKKVFSKARWKATTTGAATGIPANILVAVPAASIDVIRTLIVLAEAAAHTAIIYNEDFFEDEDAKWELLIPLFGMHASSQFARELGIRGGMGLTRIAIKKYLSKETLKSFQKIMLKYFGMKITQKALITKTLPIVGGVIGGTWNYIEVGMVRDRTIKYFRDYA